MTATTSHRGRWGGTAPPTGGESRSGWPRIPSPRPRPPPSHAFRGGKRRAALRDTSRASPTKGGPKTECNSPHPTPPQPLSTPGQEPGPPTPTPLHPGPRTRSPHPPPHPLLCASPLGSQKASSRCMRAIKSSNQG